jgi:hypothetical protein
MIEKQVERERKGAMDNAKGKKKKQNECNKTLF